MSEGKKNHMSFTDRSVIDDGIRDGLSSREIARRIKVAPSTIIREVKANRSVKYPQRKGVMKSRRCTHYEDCQQSASACERCSSQWMTCKKCKTKDCVDSCKLFELKTCFKTQSWPYVCPRECTKHNTCGYPKYSYGASEANMSYRTRLVTSREGIDISDEELSCMFTLVEPLILKGQSFEAIWAEHKDELPVCVRTFYSYQEQGITSIAAISMPQKVRRKPRKRKDGKRPTQTRIDRTGRLYQDFEALSDEDKLRVVQGDSLIGFIENTKLILSLQFKRLSFQLYMLTEDESPASVIDILDLLERLLGSPETLRMLMGILLVDRGHEFDDWAGMERSCLVEGVNRLNVYYCDASNSNQKSEAERNHELLRRILPKKRSNFDALSKSDVAWACSQVNSYPRPILNGARPYDLAVPVLGEEFLDALSILRIPPDEVTLSPKLFVHAVEQ